MTTEEQEAENERARQAALDSFATIAPAVADATAPRRVEIPGMSEASPMVIGRASPEDTGAAVSEPSEVDAFPHDYDSAPDAPQAPAFRGSDYGAHGMREMQHAIDTRAHEPASALASPVAGGDLARDDMEPLGGVDRGGQMRAPSGVRESALDRFARLGVGGDFSAQPIAPTTAEAALGLPGQPVSPASAIPSTVTRQDPATMGPDAVSKPSGTGPRPTGPQRTLDEGLPTESDIESARGGDVVRRILHALGSGLMVTGGHTAPAFQSNADRLTQERRQGLREALQRKGVQRGQEQAQEATSARQAVQDALAERRVAAAEAMVPQRQALTEAQTEATRARSGLTEAQTDRTQVEAEARRAEIAYNASTQAQREDPASTASDGMRRAVRARLSEMGALGERTGAEIGDLDTLNANQLHDILPTLMQGVGIRTSAAGGGGSAMGTSRADTRIAEAVRLGMFDSEDDARQHLTAVGADNFDRELVSRQNEMTAGETAAARARTPLAEGEQGEEVFPGLHAGIRLGTGEARAIRHDIGAVAGRMASLARMREIGDQAGWRGTISPEVAARVRPRLMQLRSMAAQIQGTGVINPSEVETINASLPDPTSVEQMTFGTLRAALDEWESMLMDTVRGNVGDTGIGLQEGADALIGRLRAAGRAGHGGASSTATARPRAPTQAPTTSDTLPETGDSFTMIRPDGSRVREVPRAAAERALRQHWRVVQ